MKKKCTKWSIVVPVFILFCINARAQMIDTISVPIFSVSSPKLREVLDSCIGMNCFQKDSLTTGVYIINVLDTAASVFTISECFFLHWQQKDFLHIPNTISLHYVICYRNSLFMVSGRSLLKKDICQEKEKMNVLMMEYRDDNGIDDASFPCAIIVNLIGDNYFFRYY